jgi:hypothetical protein
LSLVWLLHRRAGHASAGAVATKSNSNSTPTLLPGVLVIVC